MYRCENNEKITDLIIFLSQKNKYYSKVISNITGGREVSSVNIQEMYDQLPISDKYTINANYHEYLSDLNQNNIIEMTSGSTGTPLICLKTNRERIYLSHLLWSERKKVDKYVNVKNFFSLYGPKTNREIGNMFIFDKENMISCFNRMMQTGPRWICGPITAINRYAYLIEDKMVNYEKGQIKYIEFIGEYVDELTRRRIEDIFGCKTINHYGLREVWCVAYECECGHLHVLDENFIVDVHKKDELDEYGEIIITSLQSRLMPFVKYNTKDIGKIENITCECGRKANILTLAGGRTSGVIKGRKELLGDIFFKRCLNSLILSGNNYVEAFKVNQRELNKFDIDIVKRSGYTKKTEEIFRNIICKGLNENVEIAFNYVADIETLSTGKTKLFTCSVL